MMLVVLEMEVVNMINFLFLCCKYAAVCGVEMLLSFMPFTTFLIAGHQRGAEMRQHRQVRPPEGAERRQIQR